MWTIVEGEPAILWVSERLGLRLPHGVALAQAWRGEITGGVVFTGFNGFDVEATVAGSGWRRAFLRRCAEYVFDEMGASRVTFQTRSDNRAARAVLAKRFPLEGVKRRAAGSADILIFGMMKEDWRHGCTVSPARP